MIDYARLKVLKARADAEDRKPTPPAPAQPEKSEPRRHSDLPKGRPPKTVFTDRAGLDPFRSVVEAAHALDTDESYLRRVIKSGKAFRGVRLSYEAFERTEAA